MPSPGPLPSSRIFIFRPVVTRPFLCLYRAPCCVAARRVTPFHVAVAGLSSLSHLLPSSCLSVFALSFVVAPSRPVLVCYVFLFSVVAHFSESVFVTVAKVQRDFHQELREISRFGAIAHLDRLSLPHRRVATVGRQVIVLGFGLSMPRVRTQLLTPVGFGRDSNQAHVVICLMESFLVLVCVCLVLYIGPPSHDILSFILIIQSLPSCQLWLLYINHNRSL